MDWHPIPIKNILDIKQNMKGDKKLQNLGPGVWQSRKREPYCGAFLLPCSDIILDASALYLLIYLLFIVIVVIIETKSHCVALAGLELL